MRRNVVMWNSWQQAKYRIQADNDSTAVPSVTKLPADWVTQSGLSSKFQIQLYQQVSRLVVNRGWLLACSLWW